MEICVALAQFVDSRSDFYASRRGLVIEESEKINWLREAFTCLESEPIHNDDQLLAFARQVRETDCAALIVHLPIWADPILTLKLCRLLELPVLLLGNNRPDTSSLVGLLGAGGALDQVGIRHVRIFDHQSPQGRQKATAFVRAAGAVRCLNGQKLGLFGGRSLGIFTASADPAQWQRLFGIDIESIDQLEIRDLAERLPTDQVERHTNWLIERVGAVRFSGLLTQQTLEKQVRSYLATRQLTRERGFDFVGVKCQPEMSDGYVSQCVAHLLMNSRLDADGEKPVCIHACESDADGALTMQIMHLLNRGNAAALLDIRWLDVQTGLWTLANCGAVPPELTATEEDPSGLGSIRIEPHVFGQGGGAALPAVITPQPVTLARLCRRNGNYWMTIIPAEVVTTTNEAAHQITPAFPRAFVRLPCGSDFLGDYCSNHIHMTSGDITEELILFCEQVGIPYTVWK